MGGMGGEDDEGGDDSGSPLDMLANGATGPEGGRPREANTIEGEPRSPDEPTQGDEIQAADGGTMTTDTSGTSNAGFDGRGGVINIFDHIREMLAHEKSTKMQKQLLTQAMTAFDKNYKPLGLDGKTIAEYANSDEKNFFHLCEDHYGKWMKMPMARDSAEALYNLFEDHK